MVISETRTFLGGEDYLRSRGVEVVVADDRDCVAPVEELIAASPELWKEDVGE